MTAGGLSNEAAHHSPSPPGLVGDFLLGRPDPQPQHLLTGPSSTGMPFSGGIEDTN